MKHRDEQARRREVEGWKASGRPAVAYATTRGYSVSSLMRWAAGCSVAEPRFVRLQVAETAALAQPGGRAADERGAADITVEIGAARIRVARGFDAGLLFEVAAALGGGGTR